METSLVLEKSHSIFLKPQGECCNRLPAGSRVQILKRKGEWLRITWRNGKKKGWIHLAEPSAQ